MEKLLENPLFACVTLGSIIALATYVYNKMQSRKGLFRQSIHYYEIRSWRLK